MVMVAAYGEPTWASGRVVGENWSAGLQPITAVSATTHAIPVMSLPLNDIGITALLFVKCPRPSRQNRRV